jgi:hypothetical protein
LLTPPVVLDGVGLSGIARVALVVGDAALSGTASGRRGAAQDTSNELTTSAQAAWAARAEILKPERAASSRPQS